MTTCYTKYVRHMLHKNRISVRKHLINDTVVMYKKKNIAKASGSRQMKKKSEKSKKSIKFHCFESHSEREIYFMEMLAEEFFDAKNLYDLLYDIKLQCKFFNLFVKLLT